MHFYVFFGIFWQFLHSIRSSRAPQKHEQMRSVDSKMIRYCNESLAKTALHAPSAYAHRAT
jgi:hypothetical protein